jgi:hypothetical protein
MFESLKVIALDPCLFRMVFHVPELGSHVTKLWQAAAILLILASTLSLVLIVPFISILGINAIF